jgi:hypothetical protein
LKCLVPDNWSANFDSATAAVGEDCAVQYED